MDNHDTAMRGFAAALFAQPDETPDVAANEPTAGLVVRRWLSGANKPKFVMTAEESAQVMADLFGG